MLEFITHITSRYPKTLLGGLLLLTLLLGLGIGRLRVVDGLDIHLPEGAQEMQEKREMEARFGKKQTVLVGIASENIYTPATLQKIADISEALKSVEGVLPDRVVSLTTLKTLKSTGDVLDAGLFIEKIPEGKEELTRLKKEADADELIVDRLVSANGRFAVVSAEVGEGYDALALFHQLKALQSQFASPETIYLTGEPVLNEEINTGIANDTGVLVPLAILGILLGLFYCFGTWRGVVLPILVVVLAIIWTMGAMGWLGLPLTVVSNALPIIMAAVASSYGVHFMYAYYEAVQQHGERPAVVRAVLQKVGMAVVLTGTTSALGALSLLTFNIPSIRQFGVIGAIGIASATLITLTLLPSLFCLLPLSRGKAGRGKLLAKMVSYMGNIARTKQRQTGWTFGLLAALAVWGCTKIKVGADITRFFPENHEARAAAEAFNENMAGVRLFDLMIDTGTPDSVKAYENYRKISDFQSQVKALPGVGYVFSYTNIVNRIHTSLKASDSDISLADENAIAQHLILHEMSAGMEGVQSWVDGDYQRIKMQVFLKTSEPEDHKRLRAEIGERFKQQFEGTNATLHFGGDVITWIAIIREVVKGKIINIITALLLVFVVTSLLFRSLKKGLLTLIPVGFSLLFIFGLMGFLDIRLETSTALLTSMVVGVGIDFAIYYLTRYFSFFEKTGDNDSAHENTVQTTGLSIAYDVLSNVIGFSVLMLSAFVPVRNFGYLLVFSMVLIFLCTVLLLPLLTNKLVKVRRRLPQRGKQVAA